MKVDVLGVKINDITLDEAIKIAEKLINAPGKYYIVTPNPEIIVAAQKDLRYKNILNDADLAIPDGIGLKFSGKVKNRVTGVDFVEKLIGLCAQKGYTVSFLGGEEGVAEKAKERLKAQYQNISVKFAGSGGRFDKEGNLLSGQSAKIPPSDVLLVALGPGKQEKWIAANLKNTPVKLFIAVGGTLDYLSGNISRAPKFVRNLGLEWFYRVILQPWRIKRQLALIKYIWLLTSARLRMLS
ncbi:WecB/TagA/CpsF family glycosyltransferase [Candidatus Daviesbacteria bacterium]|nr:WecB/TagA/CpsF family glycosyltransferase [Candidatus Daviesbacteria bacterium]